MRHFENPFADSPSELSLVQTDGSLIEDLKSRLFTFASRLENSIRTPQCASETRGDFTVYTGTAGFAYLNLLKYLKFGRKDDLDLAREIMNNAQSCRRSDKVVSFILGDAGIYALGAVICDKQLDKARRDENLNLLAFLKDCLDKSKVPDEVLYGRSGYLYSLLFVKRLIPDQSVISNDLIRKTVDKILESGKQVASRQKCLFPPLKYYWHDSEYIGAAHGYAGILHTLLLAKDCLSQEELTNLIKPSIDFVLKLQYSSGNFKSSVDSSGGDRLVQWCHGAPAVVHLFALGYEVFNDKKYLEAALQCGDVTWQRGLLAKGYGLCHGAAGNGYTFLKLYQVTHDQRHLYRAVKFAEWIEGYGSHGCRQPDRPYSLFEGLAGTLYFLYDILNPHISAFPAYELLPLP